MAHLLSDYVSSLRHVQILNGGAGGASSFSGGSGTSITDGGSFGEDGKMMSSQETGIQDAAKSRFWRKDGDGGLASMGTKSAEYVGNPRSNVRASFLRPSVPVAGAGAVGVDHRPCGSAPPEG